MFPKIGVPQNGWFKMENPIKMDDLEVPLFLETSKCSKFGHFHSQTWADAARRRADPKITNGKLLGATLHLLVYEELLNVKWVGMSILKILE